MKKSIIIIVLLFVLVFGFLNQKNLKNQGKINGLIFLIENTNDINGLLKWEKELELRGIKALIKLEKNVFETHPDLVKRLVKNGHEIAVGYSQQNCWDMPYDEQYEIMKEYIEFVEDIIEKPVKIFSCKYFSYDQNTVKAAQNLGVEYLLARGTQDVKAVIYQPEEYDVKLISVSNVEFGDMGRGSLCDISLYSRGSTSEEFKQSFDESLAKKPDNMILVSHAHLGGTKLDWWNVYDYALNSDDIVWQSFDAWEKDVDSLLMKYNDIPVNREVKYIEPQPIAPMEELISVPELENKIVVFHNGKGPMCIEMIDFLKSYTVMFEEHLTWQPDFDKKLNEFMSSHKESEGLSSSFGYYPLIFVKDRAFSGFNNDIKNEILEAIN